MRFTRCWGVGNYNIDGMDGRVLAVDVGARRVGLAISDASRTLARPLETIAVTSEADAVDRVARRIRRACGRRRRACRRSWSGCRRTSTARRSPQTSRVAAFIERAEDAHVADRRHRRTSGCRVAKPRAGSPCTSATGASARRSSTRRRRRSSCRTIWIGRSSDRSKLIGWSLSSLVELLGSSSCWRGGGRGSCTCASTSRTAATKAPNSSSRSRRAPAASRSAIGWSRPASFAIALTFRAAVWMSGKGASAEGRRVPVRSRDDAVRSDRQDRARRRLSCVNVTFREGLTIAEMAKIFETQGLGPAAAFIAGGEGSRRRSAISIRQRRISKAICFPKPTRCRAAADAAQLVRQMVDRFQRRVHARAARRPPRRAT